MNQKKKKEREAQITHLLFTHSAAKRGENFLFSWRGPTSHPDPVLRVKRLLHGNNRARLDSFSLRQIRRSYIYIYLTISPAQGLLSAIVTKTVGGQKRGRPINSPFSSAFLILII